MEILKKLFKKPESKCRSCKWLQVAKKETEDFTAYTATVNKLCEDFKINKMTTDEFKCLIFILGLKHPKEADIRSRLHIKMDSGVLPAMTLNILAKEAVRLVNLKHGTKLGAVSEFAPVFTVKQQRENGNNSKPGKQDSPRYPCWRCGAMHFTRDCNFLQHECALCSKSGNKEGYCNVGPPGKFRDFAKE